MLFIIYLYSFVAVNHIFLYYIMFLLCIESVILDISILFYSASLFALSFNHQFRMGFAPNNEAYNIIILLMARNYLSYTKLSNIVKMFRLPMWNLYNKEMILIYGVFISLLNSLCGLFLSLTENFEGIVFLMTLILLNLWIMLSFQ